MDSNQRLAGYGFDTVIFDAIAITNFTVNCALPQVNRHPDSSFYKTTFQVFLVKEFAFDVAHEKLDSVAEILSLKPEVRWLSVTTGRFDVIAIVWFPSSEEFFTFLQTEVGVLEGVRDTETFVCLHTDKAQ